MSQSLFTKLLGFDDDEDAQAFLDHFWKDKVPAITRDLDVINIGTMKIAAAHYRAGMMYVVDAVDKQHTHQIFTVESAPGDMCGNTKKLKDGSRCPGCRACS